MVLFVVTVNISIVSYYKNTKGCEKGVAKNKMKFFSTLLLLSTTAWLVVSQEKQDYMSVPSLSLSLQVPNYELPSVPFVVSQKSIYEENKEENPNVKSTRPQVKNKSILRSQFQNKKKLVLVKEPPIKTEEQLPLINFAPFYFPQQLVNLPPPTQDELPLTQFLPPLESSKPNVDFNRKYPVPSYDLQLPSLESWNPNNDPNLYFNNPMPNKVRMPTKIYPKKFDAETYEKSKKPIKQIEQPLNSKNPPIKLRRVNEKTRLDFEKNQNKKLMESENKVVEQRKNNTNPVIDAVADETSGFTRGFDLNGEIHDAAITSLEREAVSEENDSNDQSSKTVSDKPAPKDRVEFQMHGFDGPLSYKWGFDTGAGDNRQFRYEERDNLGNVKGHYGYIDTLGKLRMVNYNANPYDGFNTETEKFER